MKTPGRVLLDTSIVIAHFRLESAIAGFLEQTEAAYLPVIAPITGKSGLNWQKRELPENDVWIGALAREHRMSIVTRDQHFSKITGIDVIAW